MNNIPLETLKTIISAYQTLISRLFQRVTKLMSETTGTLPVPPDSKNTELLKLFHEYTSDLIARRLQENNRSILLTSKSDFQGFVSIILDQAIPAEELEAEGKEEIEMRGSFLESFKENFLRVATDPDEPNDKQYEKYLRIVKVFLEATTKHNVTPDKLIEMPNIPDELIRTLYEEKELRELLLHPVNSFFNEDKLLEKLIRPTVEDAIRQFLTSTGQELSEAEIQELIQESMRDAKTKIMPKYMPNLEKPRRLFTDAFEKEIARIYWHTETASV